MTDKEMITQDLFDVWSKYSERQRELIEFYLCKSQYSVARVRKVVDYLIATFQPKDRPTPEMIKQFLQRLPSGEAQNSDQKTTSVNAVNMGFGGRYEDIYYKFKSRLINHIHNNAGLCYRIFDTCVITDRELYGLILFKYKNSEVKFTMPATEVEQGEYMGFLRGGA